jgi:hypothetical protein
MAEDMKGRMTEDIFCPFYHPAGTPTSVEIAGGMAEDKQEMAEEVKGRMAEDISCSFYHPAWVYLRV